VEDSLTTPVSQVRALVLDFDGLLVETEAPIFEIWQAIFARHGQRLLLDDWQHALGTQGGFDPAAQLAQLTGQALDLKALERSAREQHWQACRALPLLPGVAVLLDDAEFLGLGLAVASSSPRDWVSSWLQHHGIQARFGAVCVREDVVRVKPAPDLFLLAAERLRVAPDACLVFEDSPNGICAARAAGMRCVAVPSAVTRPLPLPACDLVLNSLADVRLAELLARLALAAAGQDGSPARRSPCDEDDARPLERAASSTECLR
jgi:HAD superfamily hydrolase (TIGR01509 family)